MEGPCQVQAERPLDFLTWLQFPEDNPTVGDGAWRGWRELSADSTPGGAKSKWDVESNLFWGGKQSRRVKRNFCSPQPGRQEQLPVRKPNLVGKGREGLQWKSWQSRQQPHVPTLQLVTEWLHLLAQKLHGRKRVEARLELRCSYKRIAFPNSCMNRFSISRIQNK